jgi:hypothetical protein
MVVKSPFYTYAQFCSPCVPGAGNLDNPMAEGVKTYCLGHDWFEGGVAPYPVWRVDDHAFVTMNDGVEQVFSVQDAHTLLCSALRHTCMHDPCAAATLQVLRTAYDEIGK